MNKKANWIIILLLALAVVGILFLMKRSDVPGAASGPEETTVMAESAIEEMTDMTQSAPYTTKAGIIRDIDADIPTGLETATFSLG